MLTVSLLSYTCKCMCTCWLTPCGLKLWEMGKLSKNTLLLDLPFCNMQLLGLQIIFCTIVNILSYKHISVLKTTVI